MKKFYRSQNGAISMFVMIAMLFFLVSMMGIYMISSKRAQAQTESVGLVQDKYYQEGEEQEKYAEKIAQTDEIIPIYTKEQLWSIGENKAIEIEGKVYDFSETDLTKYELKNDIVINIQTDLANSKFKDNLVFGDNTINKNGYDISYYYAGNYYVPINYSGTVIVDGTAVLSASGTDFSNISNITTGLTGEYYLFDYKNYYLTFNNLETNWNFSVLSTYASGFGKVDTSGIASKLGKLGNTINASCTANYNSATGVAGDHSLGGNIGMIIYNQPIDVTNIDKIVMNCWLYSNAPTATNYTTIGIANSNASSEYNDYYVFKKSKEIQNYGSTLNKYMVELDVSDYTGKYYLKVTTRHEYLDGLYNTSSTTIDNIYPIFK